MVSKLFTSLNVDEICVLLKRAVKLKTEFSSGVTYGFFPAGAQNSRVLDDLSQEPCPQEEIFTDFSGNAHMEHEAPVP